jgi:hypothetical protein
VTKEPAPGEGKDRARDTCSQGSKQMEWNVQILGNPDVGGNLTEIFSESWHKGHCDSLRHSKKRNNSHHRVKWQL